LSATTYIRNKISRIGTSPESSKKTDRTECDWWTCTTHEHCNTQEH
jgi:hypothetical protein